jgi:hypothetical protein
MNIPQEIIDQINDLKSQMYTKGSIIREIKKTTKDKKIARDYVEHVLAEQQQYFIDNPEKRLGDIKSVIISSSITCAVMIGITIAIPALTNGQLKAVGALLLLALASGLIAAFKLVQFAYYKMKLRATNTNSGNNTNEVDDARTWGDLE